MRLTSILPIHKLNILLTNVYDLQESMLVMGKSSISLVEERASLLVFHQIMESTHVQLADIDPSFQVSYRLA